MKIGIIGHGAIGQAVEYGFNSPRNSFVLVDSKYNGTTSADVVDTDVVFICLPTEDDNLFNALLVLEVCNHLVYYKYQGLVMIKSSLAPGTLDLPQWQSARSNLRLIINPDLSSRSRANRDFVESPMIILGADSQELIDTAKLVYDASNVTKKWYMDGTINEAILMQMFVNTMIATKIAVVSECSDMLSKFSNRSWDEIANMISHDPRVGRSHLWSPGPDGKLGYGGKHLPATMGTFIRTAIRKQSQSSTVAGAMTSNNILRK